ncbi:MAG: phytoene/squalene synthase family protein [Rhodothermales bacterium]
MLQRVALGVADLLNPGTSAEDRRVWDTFHYHSRTFSIAARLLPRPIQLPVATLYLFCRTVDTIADHRIIEVGAEEALRELGVLEQKLSATLEGYPPDEMLWRRLALVHQRVGLQPKPLYELIEGARWDLTGQTVQTEADLIYYSNLVGGCVGAMMLPFLLEDRSRADNLDEPARALGIAMQITNISRDVGEDRRELNRTYVPQAWLDEAGLDLDALAGVSPVPSAYQDIMERMMTRAEDYFDSCQPGIDALPKRVRGAIRGAARMYRGILNEVRANGYDNLTQRSYVSLPRKISVLFRDAYAPRKRRLQVRAGRFEPAS